MLACKWNGVNTLKIGRFKLFSEICSNYGTVNKELTLKDRRWICTKCNIVHDRDINAINIKNFTFKKYVCGMLTKNQNELLSLDRLLTSENQPISYAVGGLFTYTPNTSTMNYIFLFLLIVYTNILYAQDNMLTLMQTVQQINPSYHKGLLIKNQYQDLYVWVNRLETTQQNLGFKHQIIGTFGEIYAIEVIRRKIYEGAYEIKYMVRTWNPNVANYSSYIKLQPNKKDLTDILVVVQKNTELSVEFNSLNGFNTYMFEFSTLNQKTLAFEVKNNGVHNKTSDNLYYGMIQITNYVNSLPKTPNSESVPILLTDYRTWVETFNRTLDDKKKLTDLFYQLKKNRGHIFLIKNMRENVELDLYEIEMLYKSKLNIH